MCMFDPVFHSCACPVSPLRYTRSSWTPGWCWWLWRPGQTETASTFTLTPCRCCTTSPSTGSTTSSSTRTLCTCSRMFPWQWLTVLAPVCCFSLLVSSFFFFVWYSLYQSTSVFLRKLSWYLTPVLIGVVYTTVMWIDIYNDIWMSLQPGDSVTYEVSLDEPLRTLSFANPVCNVLLFQLWSGEGRADRIMCCHKSVPLSKFIHICGCSDDLLMEGLL